MPQSLVLLSVLVDSWGCCDKVPDKKSKGRRVYFGSWCERRAHHGGEGVAAGWEASGYIGTEVQEQKESNADAQMWFFSFNFLLFSSFLSLGSISIRQ